MGPHTVYLRPTCEPGLHAAPEGIIAHGLVKLTIMREGVRARPDEGHASLEHIEQLWQLVDARPAQPFSNASHTAIDLPSLNNRRPSSSTRMVRNYRSRNSGR